MKQSLAEVHPIELLVLAFIVTAQAIITIIQCSPLLFSAKKQSQKPSTVSTTGTKPSVTSQKKSRQSSTSTKSKETEEPLEILSGKTTVVTPLKTSASSPRSKRSANSSGFTPTTRKKAAPKLATA